MSFAGQPTIDARLLFEPERAALLNLLQSLTPDQWQLPTVCPGWTVHDVALHLLWVDISNISRRRDSYFGRPRDNPGSLDDLPSLVAFVNQLNANWITGARRISPTLLQSLLRTVGTEFSDYVQAINIDEMGDGVGWAGPGPAPVWLDIAREFTERWVHQQHIRDAVGIPGATDPLFLRPVLATFAMALPHALRDVEAEPGAIAELSISGESGGIWRAVKLRKGWALTAGDDTNAAGSLTLDQDIAWRLFTKGVSSEVALQTANISGEPSMTRAMLEMVTILA